eukprot:249681-Prymnesium_polylepis.1
MLYLLGSGVGRGAQLSDGMGYGGHMGGAVPVSGQCTAATCSSGEFGARLRGRDVYCAAAAYGVEV